MGNYASGNARVGSQIGSIGTVIGTGGMDWLNEPCLQCKGRRWTDVRPNKRRATCAKCGMVRDWSKFGR